MDQLERLGFKRLDVFVWNRIMKAGDDKSANTFLEFCIVASPEDSGTISKKASTMFGQCLAYPMPQYIKRNGKVLNAGQKSLPLMMALLKYYSKPGCNVLDLFAGTG